MKTAGTTNKAQGPVGIEAIRAEPSRIGAPGTFAIFVTLRMEPGWHLNVPQSGNAAAMFPTVEITGSSSLNALPVDKVQIKQVSDRAGHVTLRQQFALDGTVKPGKRQVDVRIVCQVCNLDTCYPRIELMQRTAIRVDRSM